MYWYMFVLTAQTWTYFKIGQKPRIMHKDFFWKLGSGCLEQNSGQVVVTQKTLPSQ